MIEWPFVAPASEYKWMDRDPIREELVRVSREKVVKVPTNRTSIMLPSVLILIVSALAIIEAAPSDAWNSWSSSVGQQQVNEKRDAASEMDPETMRLLVGLYQKLQNDFQTEMKRKMWPPIVSNTNPDTLNQQEVVALANAAAASGVPEKKSDRNTRNYKNCFLSPVQCVMKGRA